jgi:hypothetical protein
MHGHAWTQPNEPVSCNSQLCYNYYCSVKHQTLAVTLLLTANCMVLAALSSCHHQAQSLSQVLGKLQHSCPLFCMLYLLERQQETARTAV